MIFCAGHSKIDSGQEMGIMVNMFRQHGMGRFDDLLLRLSENPGMMYYLDNTESHKANLNENYGRELLELFSLGVGKDGAFNYSEDDVKVCARAFTGWNVAPAYPPFPHGRSPWVFRFDPADHDDSEKTFLGETGPWNGDDIIRIICEQPGTARFLARHMYNFFVADEPQVPAWRLTPPRDIEAIQILEQAYFDSGHSIKAMLEALFTSDFFKDESVRYQKVKNPGRDGGQPAPHGRRAQGNQARPVRAFPGAQVHGPGPDEPAHGEGWHTGREWIDSGTLVERINFAAEMLGNTELEGVQGLVSRLMARGDTMTPEQFVDGCLDMTGPVQVTDDTHAQLVAHAAQEGNLSHGSDDERATFTRRTGEMFQMIAATAEFQFE